MAITLSSTAKQAACNGVVDLLDAAAGVLRIRVGTTTLCDITLPAPAFGAADVAGVAAALGMPLAGTCVATGLADNYQVLANGGVLLWAGTITAVVPGTGDMILDNPSLVSGQVLSISSWNHSQP